MSERQETPDLRSPTQPLAERLPSGHLSPEHLRLAPPPPASPRPTRREHNMMRRLDLEHLNRLRRENKARRRRYLADGGTTPESLYSRSLLTRLDLVPGRLRPTPGWFCCHCRERNSDHSTGTESDGTPKCACGHLRDKH